MSADKQAVPRRTRAIVGAIVGRHFGERPRRLAAKGGGLTNLVFEMRVGGEAVILRMHSDATKVHAYLKEQWAMAQAKAVGVPTPRVLEVGTDESGWSYMISAKVEGIDGSRAPDRLAVLAELGRLAERLHHVPTHGYGNVFDWSSNRLSRREHWADYVDCELAVDRRLGVLQRHAMLDAPALASLRARLAEMRGWRKRPVLQHGDLRLKNVIVDPESGRIAALMDWENCVSSPPPYLYLAFALHDLGIDEQEALLSGYGLTPARYARVAPMLSALNRLHYADAVERLVARRDRERLAWYRLRLKDECSVC